MLNFFKKLFGMKPSYATFEEWFDDQGLKHFTGKEIASYFSRVENTSKIKNSAPPRELWENFLPVIKIVDDLREALDVSVVVTSSYRSPAYNMAVGGKSGSTHMKFQAADIQAKGIPPVEVHKILSRWRDQGRFKGGLGLYPTFVHVDTRGVNRSW